MKTSLIWHRCLDTISPRPCFSCGTRLAADEWDICSACLSRLPRTKLSDNPQDNSMARLFYGLFPIERAAALYHHRPQTDIALIIYAMKYRERRHLGITMGRVMAQELADSGFFDGVDMLIPVPLARQHLTLIVASPTTARTRLQSK